MLVYLEYTNWDSVSAFLAEEFGLNLKNVLTQQKLPIRRVRIEKWSDLSNEVVSSQDIFSDGDDEMDFLVDTGDLIVNNEFLKVIESFENIQGKFYFFSSTREKLLADEKKILKKAGVEYKILKKPDESSKLSLANEYINDVELSLTNSEINIIAKNSVSYQEIVDTLDLLSLVDSPKEALKDYYKKESLPIFMTSFNVDSLGRDVPKWLEKVTENEIQLALSLIFTKLNKQGIGVAKDLEKKLILTDQKMKTRGGIKPILWWKMFLWESLNVE